MRRWSTSSIRRIAAFGYIVHANKFIHEYFDVACNQSAGWRELTVTDIENAHHEIHSYTSSRDNSQYPPDLWKSVQFPLLRELMGGYEGARLVHFFAMAGLFAFIVIHVVMVALVPRTLLAMLSGR